MLLKPQTPPFPSRISEQKCLLLLQSSSNSLPKLLQTLTFLLKSGLHTNLLVLTRFAAISSPLSPSTTTSLLLSPSHSPLHLYDTFLFNTLLRSLSPSLLPLMLRLNIPPNHFTFPSLLHSLSHLPSISLAHSSALRLGLSQTPFFQNSLLHAYTLSHLPSARQLFDEMPQRSSVTFSAMIGGYVRCAQSNNALSLFRQMQQSNIRPDDVTIITVLSACVDLGAMDLTRWIRSYVDRSGVEKSLCLCNALVDALAKCGDVDGALEVFDEMPQRNVISWTAIINGLAMNGRGREAVRAFECMRSEGVEPDAVAFLGLLKACSHGGLVEEGRRYFGLMIEPGIEHYGCMVDLFGRAGMVEEAMEFVRAMPIRPNPIIWRTLVGACRVHKRFDLGEKVLKRLIKEEPLYGSNYVMLSNFYVLNKSWEKRWEIRKSMDERGMYKVPGFSSFELDGVIYEFVAGGERVSQYDGVYEMVEEIAKKLEGAGFVPTISEVLLDIDEEDKEDALHWHSEKLAIAFALLKTPKGARIRIVKNLRVCGDCHSATKFISKVYEREIVVRDRSRFHCFRDGVCSCADFW